MHTQRSSRILGLLHRVAATAFSTVALACDDVVFYAGDAATRIFFLEDGDLEYVQHGSKQVVQLQTWISEPVMWTSWVHMGNLVARAECQFTVVSAPLFVSTMAHSEFGAKLARDHAVDFI